MSALDIFLSHFTRLGDDECWLWRGTVNWDGYGRFWSRPLNYNAHRYAYEHFVGPIPEGMTIDHSCGTKLCVNPAHLRPMTPAANTARRRTCECGECPKCRRRAYMRAWSQKPENAAKVRARAARRRKALQEEQKRLQRARRGST